MIHVPILDKIMNTGLRVDSMVSTTNIPMTITDCDLNAVIFEFRDTSNNIITPLYYKVGTDPTERHYLHPISPNDYFSNIVYTFNSSNLISKDKIIVYTYKSKIDVNPFTDSILNEKYEKYGIIPIIPYNAIKTIPIQFGYTVNRVSGAMIFVDIIYEKDGEVYNVIDQYQRTAMTASPVDFPFTLEVKANNGGGFEVCTQEFLEQRTYYFESTDTIAPKHPIEFSITITRKDTFRTTRIEIPNNIKLTLPESYTIIP